MPQNLSSTDSFFTDVDSTGSLSSWFLIPFITISIIESILGIVGNTIVIIVISFIGKASLPHRPHNCFIVNLALSDLILCLFTMPLNTYRSSVIYMKFPPAFCKLADSFPAINVCVSSLTIVGISIYRYLVVCYPHKKVIGTCFTLTIMIVIWILAITAASPLFIYSRSSSVYDETLLDAMVKIMCLQSNDHSCEQQQYNKFKYLHVCHESWPKNGNWRLFYTIFMFFLQFILPISIIGLTYYQIMVKLSERSRYRFLIKRNHLRALQQEVRRQRRNNVLLLLIVSLYAISWLPFNISYTIFTYANQYAKHTDKVNKLSQYLPLRFLICMISAISNPFLYGYYNETFKNGLEKIFSYFCPRKQMKNKKKKDLDQTESLSMELTSKKPTKVVSTEFR